MKSNREILGEWVAHRQDILLAVVRAAQRSFNYRMDLADPWLKGAWQSWQAECAAIDELYGFHTIYFDI